jgi:hypothetical protein
MKKGEIMVGYGSNSWGTIGLCKKFGTKNLAMGAGVGLGVAGFVGGYFTFKKMADAGLLEQNKVIPYSLGLGLASGAISALVVYFTCTGVAYGFPVSRASGVRKKRKRRVGGGTRK